MAVLFVSYYNFNTLTKLNIETQLNSQINLISATIFQCKNLSNQFPVIDANTPLHVESALNTLECNTSTPYELDGGNGGFIPKELNGFSTWEALQNADEFYICTTATTLNSLQDEVLKDLNTTYSTTQYEYSNGKMKFYLSR